MEDALARSAERYGARLVSKTPRWPILAGLATVFLLKYEPFYPIEKQSAIGQLPVVGIVPFLMYSKYVALYLKGHA
jgi:hypothetical protein